MSKLLKLATAPIRYPLRLASLAAVAVVSAVALGDELRPIRAAIGHVVEWVQPASATAFDPDVASNPVKEIEFLRGLEEELDPDMKRARTLLRERRAEIEYLRELSRFLEGRIPEGEIAQLRPLVGQPAEAAADLTPTERTWLGYQRKIAALGGELERLMTLEDRVSGLRTQLDQRRAQAQGLLPEPDAPPAGPSKVASSPQMGEAEELLSGVHERLFKALYTLSPALVAEQ